MVYYLIGRQVLQLGWPQQGHNKIDADEYDVGTAYGLEKDKGKALQKSLITVLGWGIYPHYEMLELALLH